MRGKEANIPDQPLTSGLNDPGGGLVSELEIGSGYPHHRLNQFRLSIQRRIQRIDL